MAVHRARLPRDAWYVPKRDLITGLQRFEAAHERTHVDLVMALALACWRARLDAPGALGVPHSLGLG